MKRSEMIEKISNYLDTNAIYEIHPEQILKLVENAGMLPPPKKQEVYELNDDGLHLIVTYTFNPDKNGDQKNNWEDEDTPRSGAV